MIAVCFGAAGYWTEGAIAGLGGGLSAAYLVRSSIGRIDTDQLNLGFMYLMFGLVTFAGRAKSRRACAALPGVLPRPHRQPVHVVVWQARTDCLWRPSHSAGFYLPATKPCDGCLRHNRFSAHFGHNILQSIGKRLPARRRVAQQFHFPKHLQHHHRDPNCLVFADPGQCHRINRDGHCLPRRPCPLSCQASGDRHCLWPACRLWIAEFRYWQQGDFLFCANHVVWGSFPDDNDGPFHSPPTYPTPDTHPVATRPPPSLPLALR